MVSFDNAYLVHYPPKDSTCGSRSLALEDRRDAVAREHYFANAFGQRAS